MITQERLKSLLCYDADSGIFTRASGVKGAAAGSVAGCISSQGYIIIGVDYARHMAHRLAFLYMLGSMPKHQVDHINGIRTDNRWINLRDVTPQVNMQNLTKGRSGERSNHLLGVTSNKTGWQARIRFDGRPLYLGTFPTPEEAHEAYIKAKRLLHPGNTL